MEDNYQSAVWITIAVTWGKTIKSCCVSGAAMAWSRIKKMGDS
jgi:hypothetical protein